MERERLSNIGTKFYRLAGGRGRPSRGIRYEMNALIRIDEMGLEEWEPNASTAEWMLRRGLVSLRANLKDGAQ